MRLIRLKASLLAILSVHTLTACEPFGAKEEEEEKKTRVLPTSASIVDPGVSPTPEVSPEPSPSASVVAVVEPTVTAVAPPFGPAAGGTTITLTGTLFGDSSAPQVQIGGVDCASVTLVSSTELTCVTPAGSAGAADVVVVLADGGAGTLESGFTFVAAPVVTAILPSTGKLAGGETLNIVGSGIQAGATVSLGGQPCIHTSTGAALLVSSSQIICNAPAGSAGAVDLVISNPDAQASAPVTYRYNAIPSVTSVSPTSGHASGTTTLTVTGTGFLSGASVLVGGNTCSQVEVTSETQIRCTAPAHAAGAVDVQATNSDTQSATLSSGFTYVSGASLAYADAPTYSFGSVAGGSSANHDFTISNSGAYAASSITASMNPATDFAVSNDTCTGTSVAATNGSCSLRVTFAPTASGVRAATLTLRYNNGATIQTASQELTGTGLGGATLAFSGAFDFGSKLVGTTQDLTFTISNSGASPASGVTPSTAAPFSLVAGGDCGATLAASTTCTLVGRFSPSAPGAASGSLSIAFNDSYSAQTASQALSGTGLAPASLAFSGSFDFGSRTVGSSADLAITLANSGDVSATAVAPTTAAPFSVIGGGSCGATLGAGASCSLNLRYNPAGAAAHSDSLAVSYHDGVQAQAAAQSLSGTGLTPAALAFSPATYDFGLKTYGQTYDTVVTITNSGGSSASTISPTATAPFSTVAGGSCGSSLAAAGSCTMNVRYTATIRGKKTDTLALGYNDGAAAQTANLTLQGTAGNRLSGGFSTVCGINSSNQLKCWGQNDQGQISGDYVAKYSPTLITGLGGNPIGVSAIQNATCAIIDTGAVKCWGLSGTGLLGYQLADNTVRIPTPTAVYEMDGSAPDKTAVKIEGGLNFQCVLTAAGSVKCWGVFPRVFASRTVPILISGMDTNVKDFTVSTSSICALYNDDSVKCQGDGSYALGAGVIAREKTTLLYGNGTGGFPTSGTLSGTHPYTTGTVIADFNGDGKADVASLQSSQSKIAMYYHNAGVGFAAPVFPDTAGTQLGIGVGDFNGDGKKDIVVGTNAAATAASVLLRKADNTGFDAAVNLSGGTNASTAITVGDFNEDGRDDIAGYGTNQALVWIRSADNSGFNSVVTYSTSPGLSAANGQKIATGDLNGDGILDLVITSLLGRNLRALYGNGAAGVGNGTFQAVSNIELSISTPGDVAVGDLNGDGKADIAVSLMEPNVVRVYLRNAGNTGFDAGVDYSTGLQPLRIQLKDINADGYSDLVVANWQGDSVTVRNGVGDGTFGAATEIAAGESPHGLAIGDLDQDGKQDIAVANYGMINPIQVAAPGNAFKLMAGGYIQTCLVTGSGSTKCWGNGVDRRIDMSTASTFNAPTTASPVDVVSYDLNGSLGCYVNNSSAVKCHGTSGNGRMGIGSSATGNYTSQTIPEINGLGDASTQAREVAVTYQGTGCALLKDDSVKCWGYNTTGAVGDGTGGSTAFDRWSPVSVSGF